MEISEPRTPHAARERPDTKATPSIVPEHAFDSLAEDGYCVVPGFLPPETVATVLADYRSRGASDNANYQIGLASDAAVRAVRERIAPFAGEIARRVGVRTHFDGLHQAYYFDTQVLKFNAWHQDAESHYMLGTHAHYLNFYMPIHKEVREKTNLQVVPASAIRERAPEAWPLLRDGGGTICRLTASGETLIFDEAGERVTLPFDIDELAVTPQLEAGDLLLMRGDTLHRTQAGDESDPPRVALSLRLVDPDLPIRLDDLARGSSKKVNLMAGNWAEFGPVFEFLADREGGSAPWREVRLAIERRLAGNGPRLSKSAARLRIVREKLRRGTLLDTARRELSYRSTLRRHGI